MAKKVTENKEQKVEQVEQVKRTSATATSRGVGVTPRKVRLVIDLVRGKSVVEAYDILNNLNKAAKTPVLKLIKSAVANATHNFGMNEAALYIDTIYANDGPRLKRYLPRAKGSASGLVKRWSHITVVVKEKGAK